MNADSLTIRRVVPIVLFSMLFVLAVRQSVSIDPDLWWHLKAGQQILDTRSIQHTDNYSFTKQGSEWVAHEWLSEVIMQVIYRVGGLTSLVTIFSLIIVIALWLTYHRCEGRPYAGGIAIVLAAAASFPLFGVRPQMLTLLLASIYIAILEQFDKRRMIYALFLLAGSDVAAKLFSLFLAIATSVLLYAFCCRFITRSVGVIALFAFLASGMIVELAVTTRIDVSLAGMLFACTYAMINYLTTRGRAWLWVSAVFAGFSLGIKHTAALWIFFVGILYLLETIRSRESIRKVLQYGVIYTFLALVVASPWYIKNAIWFDNPIYPFVTGEVAEFGPNGVRYFNAEDERKLDANLEAARKAIPDVVAAQQQELTQAASTRVERHPMRLWEFFFRSRRLSARLAVAKRIPVYVVILALAPIITNCIVIFRHFNSVHYVTGTVSRDEFLTQFLFYRPIEFVNRELPSTARGMMIRDQTNYGLKRPYYADESWFATKWRRLLVENDSLDAVNEQLKQQGFTHIIYSPSLFIFAAQMGLEGTGGMSLIGKPEDRAGSRTPEYPLLRNWSTFTLYKERYLEPVYKDEYGHEVLRIK